MTLSKRQRIFARNVAKLIDFIYESNDECTIGEALRTPEMADLYVRLGKGIKNSLHIKKLAIDLNLFKGGVYVEDTKYHEPYGKYWVSLHPSNRWGGDWDKDGIHEPGENDGNHYEMREDL